MKIGKRGKDLAVRIPVAVVKRLELKSGDEIEVFASAKRSLEIRKIARPETGDPAARPGGKT